MYISTSVKDGRVYATASKSVRKGAKVGKSDSKYLGRVIDREKGIYKNKERGLFMYDEKTDTFSPVPADYQEPKLKRKKKYPDRPEHIVSFGDVYLLLQFLVHVLEVHCNLPTVNRSWTDIRPALLRCPAF